MHFSHICQISRNSLYLNLQEHNTVSRKWYLKANLVRYKKKREIQNKTTTLYGYVLCSMYCRDLNKFMNFIHERASMFDIMLFYGYYK